MSWSRHYGNTSDFFSFFLQRAMFSNIGARAGISWKYHQHKSSDSCVLLHQHLAVKCVDKNFYQDRNHGDCYNKTNRIGLCLNKS